MKSIDEKRSSSYARAQKRVAKIKSFYGHVTAYIIVNIVLLLSKGRLHFMLLSEGALGNPKFLEWFDWNVYGTPIIWGIGLAIHALFVFKSSPFLGKEWEEKQLRKYLDND